MNSAQILNIWGQVHIIRVSETLRRAALTTLSSLLSSRSACLVYSSFIINLTFKYLMRYAMHAMSYLTKHNIIAAGVT